MTTTTRHLLVAVVLGPLALTGCGDDAGAGAADVPAQMLTIEASDWNGWDPEHQATPEVTTLEVEVGATATVESVGEEITFEVTEVGDGEVEVSSDQRLAPSGESGGSNLNDLVEEFTVVTGEETSLATPTLDAGYSYLLTLTRR
ncbi:hypothetical protein FE634_02575 [Nocardioides dongxiaopingii]|uniref:hypothetical protein n=1 Tax=Nocardioides sp. S-1144 TaxID=2582905 RepID=UPI00110EBEE2|nr:hypothetical protein [Nocardioides sp. S-1144]QCW49572.1 hypothetical protein FE634_02575 [Nocardioides sp. S-1144]